MHICGGHLEFGHTKNSSWVTKWHHPDSDSRHLEVQYTSVKHIMDAKTTLCALQLD